MGLGGAISGVGETDYSRHSGRTPLVLQLQASLRAIEDAGLSPKDIDGIVTLSGGGAIAEDFATGFGLPDLKFAAGVSAGGASAIGAIQCAAAVIGMGICRHVLIPAGRNGYSGTRVSTRSQSSPQRHVVAEFETPLGAIAPVQLYAMMARRHMELYGTTSRQLGEIAVTTRAHAALNANSIMTKPITIDDHQNSPMICDPLRLFDCCLESDGGAAIIVSASDRAGDLRRPPIRVAGSAVGHPDSPSIITQRGDITRLGIARAAPRAFAEAGVAPADIQVAEIYDCFTYIVLCQLEDMGFCPKGEGGPFVESGALRLGGALPTNTHGGLLSQAHVSGMNHVVELVRQLRGEAGLAQVHGAEIGLVTGYGDQGAGALAILRRSP